MGNCIRHEESSAANWAGEEWDFLATTTESSQKAMKVEDEKEGLLGGGVMASSAPASYSKVKIKITKKQLEELLGKVDVKELSVQQVLTQLINVGNQFHDSSSMSNHRSWRPVLQSIPEVN